MSRAWIASIALAAACLAGCATPDVKPFAEQTARLAAAVADEQREIQLKFMHVEAVYEEVCKSERATLKQGDQEPVECIDHDAVKRSHEQFKGIRTDVDGLLSQSVVYANALVDLANAGATGKEAAQSLGKTLDGFGALAGAPGVALSASAKQVLQLVADFATTVQAQNSLASATATAQPAIRRLADGIEKIRKAEDDLAGTLVSKEKDVARTVAGDQLIRLFRKASASTEAVDKRLAGQAAKLAQLEACPPAGGNATCNDLRNSEDLARLMDRLRPRYEAYTATVAAATRWRALRSENAIAIERAVEAWKAEHERLAGYLARCGGLRASQCVQFDSANLRVLVDRINEVRSLKEK